MKKKSLLLLFIFISICAFAVDKTVNGTESEPGPATYDNLVLNTGIYTISSGTVTILNNIEFNGGSINLAAGATLILEGTTAQTITGTGLTAVITGVDGTLAMNNTNGVTIDNSASFATLNIFGILAPITGNLETNGKLTLNATTPNSYARVALNDGGPISTRSIYDGTITGNIDMKHVFTSLSSSTPSGGGYNGDWYQMSLPLNTDLANGWTDLTLNFTGSPSTQNAYWYDASPSGNNTGATQPVGVTVREDANGWTDAVGTDDETKAYTMFLTSDGPFETSPTVTLTGTADLTQKDFTSEIFITADPNRPLAANVTDNPIGWTLLRNPWPSIIETETWFSTVAGGGVQADYWDLQYIAVHVWDSKSGQYTGWTISDFGTPSFSTIDYNTSGGVTAGFAAADKNIAPFQAFWVKTSQASLSAGGKVILGKQFSETEFGDEVFHKTTNSMPETAVLFAYDTDSLKDITLVFYNDGMSDQFDLHGDIYKLGTINPSVPSLYIQESGQHAQSAGRPFKSIDTVEVFYESSKNNTTAHLWLNDTNIAPEYDIMLLDKLTQQTQDMRANATYSFTHNTNNAANRFQLIVTNKAFSVGEINGTEKPITVYMANNALNIESINFTGPAHISMYDLSGKLIVNQKIELTEGSTNQIALSEMATGMYTTEITFDGKVIVEKLMR